jgi:hypothetical protein
VAEDVAGVEDEVEAVDVVAVEGVTTRRMMIERGRDKGVRPVVLRPSPASAGLFFAG